MNTIMVHMSTQNMKMPVQMPLQEIEYSPTIVQMSEK